MVCLVGKELRQALAAAAEEEGKAPTANERSSLNLKP